MYVNEPVHHLGYVAARVFTVSLMHMSACTIASVLTVSCLLIINIVEIVSAKNIVTNVTVKERFCKCCHQFTSLD